MSLNRHRARTDANHREITGGLRDAGVMYWYTKQPCDLIIAHRITRHPMLVEIKADRRARLTELQQQLRVFIHPDYFHRVETIEQALSAAGAI